MTRLLVALACGAVLWCSGCSTTASSTADPPPTASTTFADPTPAPETPEEFVRRWVAADTHMQNTGDGAEYRAMSRKCTSCLEYADYIEGIWKAGGYIETRGWLIRRSRTGRRVGAAVEVTLDVTSTAAKFVEKAGGPVQRYPKHDLTYIVALRAISTGWSATEFSQVAQ